jgi:hypothetical protein
MSGYPDTSVLRGSYECFAHRFAAAVFTVIIVGYLGLIGVGQWQGDEFADFALETRGWPALFHRLTWSPRPLSESLFAFYGWLTLRLERPLIPVFLGLLWTGFLLAGFARSRTDPRTENRKYESRAAGLTGLALIAAFLTANYLTEVFYWPAGAVAYLPSLSASLYLFLQVARGALESPEGRLRCSIALFIAAFTSETGAFLVTSYATVLIVAAARSRIRRRSSSQNGRSLGWVFWPGVAGALVLLTAGLIRFRLGRFNSSELYGTKDHPAASIAAALSNLVANIFGPGQQKHGWILFNVEFLSVILLALGIGLSWNRVRRSPARHRDDLICLASVFLLAAFLTLFASHIHLGTTVGERHQVMVRCWVRLAVASAAIVVLGSSRFQRLRERPLLQASAPIFLICSVVLLWQVKPLWHQYRGYRAIYLTIQDNFRSGFEPGNETIEWVLPPNRGVMTFAAINPGKYSRAEASAYPRYILDYFNKPVIIVRGYAK